MIRNRLTSVQRIEVANDRIGDQNVLDMVLQSDIEKIRLTLEDIDRDSFDKATDAIVAARRIYIIGVRSSAAIATFLGFYFNLLFDNVAMITANTPSEVFESLLRVGEGDVVVGISFPRYSSRAVQAMNFARDRGATTIAITDSDASPLAVSSKYTLKARSDMASFVDSLVAPLSLVNALLVEVSRKKMKICPRPSRLWSRSGRSTGSIRRLRTTRYDRCIGNWRRSRRNDGGSGRRRSRRPGVPVGAQSQGGTQAVYYRQGPVQRNEPLRRRAGACQHP